MRKINLLVCCLAIFTINSCLVIEHPFSKIPAGYWRATLDLSGKQEISGIQQTNVDDEDISRNLEAIKETELPFLMEVKYYEDKPDDFYIEIINGNERIRVEDIQFGRSKERAIDTVRINFPHFDTYIIANFKERILSGHWVVNYKEDYKIPFKAKFGENFRFTEIKTEPKADLSGKWAATFGLSEAEPYPAVGEFLQKNNEITGTFRTETGDYRFLAGTVQLDKFHLSCFDGAHAFLFNGKILDKDNIIGSFRSGNHYLSTWEAMRDNQARLQNPDSLTFINPGYDQFSFTFENSEGKMVSLNDAEFEGKAKIIQIMGTWCPNCLDETEFLKEYLRNNPNDKLAVIGLAFERYKDQEKNKEVISRYKKELKIPYPILLAGTYQKDAASKALPMLSAIISYPTMIFLNKENEVVRIHTGFSGPATSVYPEFKKEFERFIKRLTQEKGM